jgi:hypothetical protein
MKTKILKQWAVALSVAFIVTAAQAQNKKPNILFIMVMTLAGSTSAPITRGSCPE